jgi:hypothetical protein
MKCKRWKMSTHVMLVCVGTFIFCQTPSLDGGTQSESEYTGAGKILIPHKSWPCGMAEGIPVPERGVPVFEANLKLDQAYDAGRTPYGQRDVFGFCDAGRTGLSVEFFERRLGN